MLNSVIISQGRDYYMDDEIKILIGDELETSFTDSAFKLYMQEIRRYPNLSIEQQKI